MGESVLDYYLRAGEISYRVKKFIQSYVRPGLRLLDVANTIENYIRELGGQPAFPLNISINYVAAHRTPLSDEVDIIPDGSVVKIDLGVHVEGYIADTALTLVFNDKYIKMAEANREALYRALRSIKPGMRFSDVGGIIESTIKRRGFKVIKNLSGHSLDRYLIHGGDIIPNYRDPLTFGRFKVGRAYAIEPFVTNGKGYVKEVRSQVQIYALRPRRSNTRNLSEKESMLIRDIESRFKTLPFCERWLKDTLNDVVELRSLLKNLVSKGVLTGYPVLIEAGRGFVTQFEETVFITPNEVIVTTNPEIKQ